MRLHLILLLFCCLISCENEQHSNEQEIINFFSLIEREAEVKSTKSGYQIILKKPYFLREETIKTMSDLLVYELDLNINNKLSLTYFYEGLKGETELFYSTADIKTIKSNFIVNDLHEKFLISLFRNIDGNQDLYFVEIIKTLKNTDFDGFTFTYRGEDIWNMLKFIAKADCDYESQSWTNMDWLLRGASNPEFRNNPEALEELYVINNQYCNR